jgi:metacaspase-1
MPPTGRSLHIGLNTVDPSHYDGWDGRLYGCHNDALAMQAIADSLDYTSQVMLDDAATAEAVIAAIREAAQSLSPGDTFLVTYSGHGGQVDDTNGDESLRDYGELGESGDRYDETWLLFDRMLVDDELWALWSEFPEGARIAVLSDSCHSGSVTRAAPHGPDGEVAWQRRAPLDVEIATYEQHKDLYDGIQAAVPPREASTIGATVVLASGCQDNQTSADGRGNGLFTGTLLDVWQDGQFQGSLHALRDQIAVRMPTDQTPNYYVVGTPNHEFESRQALQI